VEQTTSADSALRSDADLIASSRAGDAGSFGVLYARHSGAALVVARQYTSARSDAEDVVADAFAAVWAALQGGSGPNDAFRAYLFTVVRRTAAVQRTKGRRTEPTDDVAILEAGSLAAPGAEEPTLAGFERTLVARAFASLPERWQAVLWHNEIEGLTPAEIAPLLGLTANSTAALAYRAREGLRQAYLQQHLAEPLDESHRAVAAKLGGYVRGGLGARDTTLVETHLDECGECRALVLELRDVNRGLRGVIAPLVLGVVGMGALRYTLPTSGGTAAGAASLAAGGGGAAGAGGAGLALAGGAGGAAAVGTAAGAAASSGVIAALVAALGGVPTAIAAGLAGLAVVAGAALGIVQLVGAGEPLAEGAATPTATAVDRGAPAGATSGTADPAPAAVPALTPRPTETPVDGSVDGSTGTAADAAGAGLPTAAPATDPAPTPTPDPTGPASTPIPDSTATPPPAGPPHLLLAAGTTSLEAGAPDQELAIVVSNDGGSPATGLTASLQLPTGVSVTGVTANVGGALALPAAAAGWSCAIVDAGADCTLPVLDAGTSARLAVQVDVPEDFASPDGRVVWRVAGAGLDATSSATAVTVTPAPARLVVARTGAVLARGRTMPLDLTVTNAGGVAGDATVILAVPAGLTITGTADAWTCRPGADLLRCTQPDLAARTSSRLALSVAADESATPGSLQLTVSPAGRAAPSAQAAVPYTLAAPVLSLDVAAAADGRITATVGAGTAAAYGTRLTVTVPDGLSFDPKTAGWPATCDVAGATATCALGTVAYAGSSTVVLPSRVEAAIADEVTATATATDAAPVTATAPVGTASSGLSVRFQSKDRQTLAAVQIGAPVLGCSGCGTGGADNNGLPLKSLGATSSTLGLPPGATIEYAGLYWSANRYQGEAWSSDPATVRLRAPGGSAFAVADADGPEFVLDGSRRTYYQSFADVTELVRHGGGGAWTVGDVAVSAGILGTPLDPVPTYYGGWVLVVVYDDPHATPGALTVYDGAAWVASGQAQEFAFPTTPGATAEVGVVAWEGDRATTGDRLLLDGVALTPRSASGLGSSSNAFDATATGWSQSNSLGVDAKSFVPGTTNGDGTVSVLAATSTGDQYLLGAVTVRVEQPPPTGQTIP